MWRTPACRVGTPADTMAGEHRSAVAPRSAAESQVPAGCRIVKADLQNAAIESLLQTKVILEYHLHTLRSWERVDLDRVESLVVDGTGTINKRSIRWESAEWEGSPELEVTHNIPSGSIAFVATQKSGSAGGVTLSNCSPKFVTPPHPSELPWLLKTQGAIPARVTTAAVPIANVVARLIATVHITLSLPCGEQNRQFIADNPSKAGWSWGCVSAVDSNGRTIWIADAHRDDGKRLVVRAVGDLT